MFGPIYYLNLEKSKQFITEKTKYDNIFVFSKFIVKENNKNKTLLLNKKKSKNKFIKFLLEERNNLNQNDINNIWAQVWNFFVSCKMLTKTSQNDIFEITNINLFKYLSINYQNSLAFLFIRCIIIAEKLDIEEIVKNVIFEKNYDSEKIKNLLINAFRQKYTQAKNEDYIMNSLRTLVATLSYGLKGKFSISRKGNQNTNNKIKDISYYKDNTKTEKKNLKKNTYISNMNYSDFLNETAYIINNMSNNEILKKSLLFSIFCLKNENIILLDLNSETFTIKNEEEKIKQNQTLTKTEKENLIKSRIGQGTFRKKVLNDFKKCIFTSIDNEKLLIASHIKPWNMSNNKERLDVNNGLLLSPTYDKLFDLGLISFDKNKVLISSSIISDKKLLKKLNIYEGMELIFKLTKERESYLKFHKENIFKK